MKRFLYIVSAISILFLALELHGQELKITRKYELIKLEGGINTRHDDAAPVISPDGTTLYYFISDHPDNNYGENGSQDIWLSRKDANGVWSAAEHVGSPLNQNRGNQVFTVLNGGNTLFIRGTASKDATGFSITNRQGNGWSRPSEIKVEGFEEMNKNRFYGATLSSDMEHMILYFSTNPRLISSDLFYSQRISGNKFSKPVKIPILNTGWDEFGPFLSPDNKSIYFASDRKGDVGLGGADLYVSRRLDDSWLKWSKPENLGPPINTAQFDGYISIDTQGNIYLAMAGKKIDGGNLDILQVVPKDIHINLTGLVKDQSNDQPMMADVFISRSGDGGIDTLRSASAGFKSMLPGEGTYTVISKKEGFVDARKEFTLKDVYNDTTVNVELLMNTVRKEMRVTINAYDSKTGELISGVNLAINDGLEDILSGVTAAGQWSSEMQNGGAYGIRAQSSGYLDGSGSFEISQDNSEVTADVYLDPIEVGTTVVLENIYFDFDKTTLKSESFVELDKVVDFLISNGTLQIEISGHTDSKGGDDYNETLSQGRAESVVQYLIDQGIDSLRLVAKGYGEAKPIDTNETDEGRAKNRRVEFTVLAK